MEYSCDITLFCILLILLRCRRRRYHVNIDFSIAVLFCPSVELIA